MSVNTMDVKIVPVTPADRDAVLEFLRKWYYSEEPISVAIEPRFENGEEDEEFTMEPIPEGFCLQAVDATGKVVGAAMSGLIRPGDAELLWEMSKTAKCPKWSTILKLLSTLEKGANVCGRFAVAKVLHLNALAVNPHLRGQAIGKRLILGVFDLARSAGLKYCSMDCTSVYSIAAAEQLGMECIQTVAYVDYKDADGNQVFFPPAPHTQIKTFVKPL